MRRIPDRGLWITDCLLVLAGMAMFSVSISAQEPPIITVSKGDKISLTVSALTGGEGGSATKVLQNDLALSGYFTLGSGAAYTARGSAGGGTLQGQVVDHGGGTVLSK